MDKSYIGWIVAGLVLFFVIVVGFNSCSIVQQRERGVEYFLGRVNGDVIQPGVKLHTPFLSNIKTYSIAPRNSTIKFTFGSDAAVTKDMQSIGLEANITYKYDESGIMLIATDFGDSIIEETFKRNLSPAIKTVIGKYSIYDVTANQDKITSEVQTEFAKIMGELNMPVSIIKVSVSNYDWSEEFDRSIQSTMKSAQEAKKAEQDLKIVETESQKKVALAKADLEAKKLNALADLEAKKLEAEAVKVKADADLYMAQQLAKAAEMKKAEWKHEEEMSRINKWDGKYVPTNNYGPIPVQSGSIQGH